MGKTQNSKTKSKSFRSVPLAQQLLAENSVKLTIRQKKRKREEEEEDDDAFVDEKTAKKILREVEKQRRDIKEDKNEVENILSIKDKKIVSDSDSEDDNEHHFEEDNNDKSDDEVDEQQLSEFSKFENCNGDDLVAIMKEKETEILTEFSDVTGVQPPMAIDPQTKKLYAKVGDFLSTYRSGKLPKPFKHIPHFRNWEEFLDLTKPEKWTAAAVREATKMCISNLKETQAARFLKNYLLPRVRDDIEASKKLNPHLHESVSRAVFKARAFFEGFILPLCESGTCTLKEATIVSGVLKTLSINVLASGAALISLAKLPYSGSTMLIMQSILEKKYSLPLLVIQTLTDYFIRFMHDKDFNATVIWHQGLLAFVQLCKFDIEEQQRNQLLELIKVHHHHEISEEIQRELCAPRD